MKTAIIISALASSVYAFRPYGGGSYGIYESPIDQSATSNIGAQTANSLQTHQDSQALAGDHVHGYGHGYPHPGPYPYPAYGGYYGGYYGHGFYKRSMQENEEDEGLQIPQSPFYYPYPYPHPYPGWGHVSGSPVHQSSASNVGAETANSVDTTQENSVGAQ